MAFTFLMWASCSESTYRELTTKSNTQSKTNFVAVVDSFLLFSLR